MRAISAFFAEDGSARLDQRHQRVEGASTELNRPAVGQQFAALRHYPETPEPDAPRRFGGGIHQYTLIVNLRKFEIFFGYLADAGR
jgi:hypothetical protein